MAKKQPKQAAPEVEAPLVETAEAAAPKEAAPRGPKDVALDAEITLVATENPKRVGSKAHERFALYQSGMTVKGALDAGITTPDLIYDSAHGFITIAGYDPKVKFLPKVKEPKAPKEPKAAKKGKKSAAQEDVVADEEVVE
jgi:hypothetical protein